MRNGSDRSTAPLLAALCVAVATLFLTALYCGSVSLPGAEVTHALLHGDDGSLTSVIVLQSRLPMALTALLAGGALALSGLILQTVFNNPLAGPSILGVSSGASLGIALIVLGGTLTGLAPGDATSSVNMLTGALLGAGAVILMLVGFSSVIHSGVMLLIVGVMISYFASSLISVLSYLAPAQQIKDFTIWGMGSFSGITTGQLPLYATILVLLSLLTLGSGKPLDALLLGERYALSLGYRVKITRTWLLALSGALAAVVTAYCGPIGFVGIIVPHLARMFFRTSRHSLLLPASFLTGGAVALLCAVVSNTLIADTQLPVNVVTPVMGVPVILLIILQGRRSKLM